MCMCRVVLQQSGASTHVWTKERIQEEEDGDKEEDGDEDEVGEEVGIDVLPMISCLTLGCCRYSDESCRNNVSTL